MCTIHTGYLYHLNVDDKRFRGNLNNHNLLLRGDPKAVGSTAKQEGNSRKVSMAWGKRDSDYNSAIMPTTIDHTSLSTVSYHTM
jgi:hypothetical protein